jgi:hypothetical protein
MARELQTFDQFPLHVWMTGSGHSVQHERQRGDRESLLADRRPTAGAARVASVVFASNLARVAHPADYKAFTRSHVYKPEYRNLL